MVGPVLSLVVAMGDLSIASALVEGVGALSCLGGPVSGLVVAVEALPNNITTSIIMKQQVLSQRKGFRISLRGGF